MRTLATIFSLTLMLTLAACGSESPVEDVQGAWAVENSNSTLIIDGSTLTAEHNGRQVVTEYEISERDGLVRLENLQTDQVSYFRLVDANTLRMALLPSDIDRPQRLFAANAPQGLNVLTLYRRGAAR